MPPFLLIMFAQCDFDIAQPLDARARLVVRDSLRNLAHHFVYVFQLPYRAPSFVWPSPARPRRHPHGESLREIFVRVRLRVPAGKVEHEITAVRLGLVPVGIGPREGAEQLAVAPADMQTKSVVYR